MEQHSDVRQITLFEEGIFYHAYGADAEILSEVTGYKVVKTKWMRVKTVRCGFPMEAQDKVEEELKRKNIHFRYMVKSPTGKWIPEDRNEGDDIQDVTDSIGSDDDNSLAAAKPAPNVLTIRCA